MDLAYGPHALKRRALACVLGVPGLSLGLLLLYPLAFLLISGLAQISDTGVWTDPFFWRVLRFTYLQAFLSAVLSGVVGISGALLYSEQNFLGRRAFWRLSLACFSLPTILVVLSFLGLWGIRYFQGWHAILIAHVFFNFPLYLKNVGTALVGLDRTEEKAALSLGASRLRCFFQITSRKVLPACRSAFFLSFLYCSTSFLIVLMLGGGPRFTTLEVAVYQAIKIDFDLALASRLAVVQLAGALLIYLIFLKTSAVVPSPVSPVSTLTPLYLFRSKTLNLVVRLAYCAFFLALVVAPLLALLSSGIPALLTADWASWRLPILTSLQLGFAVGGFSLLLAFLLSYAQRHAPSVWVRETIPLICSLPVSVSTILLTLSLMYTYPGIVMALRGSLWTIIAVQSVAALPLVFRPLHDGFLRIPVSLYLAARSLGASPWQTLCQLELPLLRRSLLLSFLLGMTFSLGEVGSVLVFLSEEVSTVPLQIYRSLSGYRFDEAYALGSLLLIVLVALNCLMEWREK